MMSALESSAIKSSPYFISALSSKSVQENGDTTLSCMVSGNPKPEVTWYRNGQDISELKKNLNCEILEDNLTYVLHLFRCTEQQAGVYQIVARNCFGMIQSSAFLKVSAGAKPEVYEKLICTPKDNIETCRANEDAACLWKNSHQVIDDKDALAEKKDSTHRSFGSSESITPECDDLSSKFFHPMECGIFPPMENQSQNAHCLGDNMEVKNVLSSEENNGSVSSMSKNVLNLIIFGSIEGSRDTAGGEVDKQVDSKPANQITDHTNSCCFNGEVLAACQTTEYAKTHEEGSLSTFLEKGTLYGNHSSEPLENQTCCLDDSCKNVDRNFELLLDRNSITSDEPFEDDHLEHLECSSVMTEEQNWEEKLKFLLESDDEDELNLGSDCDGCAYFLGEMPCLFQVSDNTVPMDATIGFCDHPSKSKEVAVRRSDLTACSPSTLQTGMTLTVGQQQTKTSTVKDKEKYKLPVASTAIENDYPRIEESNSKNHSAVDFSVVRSQGIDNENLEMDSSPCNLGDSSAATGKPRVDRGFLRKNLLPLTKRREKLSKGKVNVGVASWTKVSEDSSHLLHPRNTSDIRAVQTESYLDSAERLHERGGSISSEAHKDIANASNNQSGLFPGKGRDKNGPREGKWISGQSKRKQMPDENAMLMVEKQETDIENTAPISDELNLFITEPELDESFVFTSLPAKSVSGADENPALENVSGRNGFQVDNAMLEKLCHAPKRTCESVMQELCCTRTLPVTTIDNTASYNVPDALEHTHATSKQKSSCDIVTSMALPVKQMEERETNGEKPHEINESKTVCDTPGTEYLSKVDFQAALESAESEVRDADLSSMHEQLQKLLYEEDDWSYRYDFTCPSSEVKSLAAGTDVSAEQHVPGNLTEDNQLVTELATPMKGHTDFNSLLKTDEACSSTSMGQRSLTLPVESDAMCLCSAAFGHQKEKPSVHLLSSNLVNAQMYLENKHSERQPDHNRSIQMSTSQEGIMMNDNALQSCGVESSVKLPEAPNSPFEFGQEMLSDVPANYLGQLSYTEQDVHCTDRPIAKQTYKLPTKESNVTICHSGIKEYANLAELSLKEDSSSNLSDKNTDQFTSEEHSSVTAVSKCTEDTFQEKGTESEMKAQNDNISSIYLVLRGNNSKDFQGVSDAENCGCYIQEHNFVTDTASKVPVDQNGLEDTSQDSKRVQEGTEEPVFTASYKVKLFTELLLEINKNDENCIRQARKVLGATAEQTDPESKHELEVPPLDSQQSEKESRIAGHLGEIVKGLGMDSVCITSESEKAAALNTIQHSDIRNEWNATSQSCQNTSNMTGSSIIVSTQDKHQQENVDKDCSISALVTTRCSSVESLMQTESMLIAVKEEKDVQTPELSQDQYQRVEEKSETQLVQCEREREIIMTHDLETTEVEPYMWSLIDSEDQINSCCDSTKLQGRYQKVQEKSQTKIIPCERDAEETQNSMVCHLEEAEVEPYMRALIKSEEMYSWHDSIDFVHLSTISSSEQTAVGGNVVTSTGHSSARARTVCGSQNLGSSEHAIGTLVSISPWASENSHQSQEQLPQGKTQPCTLAATAEDPCVLKEERAKLQEASKLCKSPSSQNSLEDMKHKQVTVKKKMMSKVQVKKPRLEEAKENVYNNASCMKKVSKTEAGLTHKEDQREQRKLPCKKDKAPKLLKNIQAELFPDFSGNIKLCCQFGEIHEDSIITWTKDSKLLARVQRSAGDDFPVSLAIVQAGKKDQGLYYCCLKNVCGKATAEFHLTSEVLEHLSSFQDVEGLEEIEFLQLMFREDFISNSYFSNSLHGRIATEELHFGEGVHRKAFRSKVMQGLVPVFSPGHPCVLKVHSAIAYGTKNNDELVKKNYKLALQECYVQNTAREYAKIYAAETKILEGFGEVPEIIPIFLIHRPQNNIPYATVEEELIGEFVKYSVRDGKEINFMRRDSEAGQKCCTFQHWVYERTSGSLLITDMQGVGMKLTDVGIATLTKGYKGFKGNCSSSFIDQFKALHQCNKYCEMLGLLPLQTNCQKQRKPTATKTKAQPSLNTVKKTVISAQAAKKT